MFENVDVYPYRRTVKENGKRRTGKTAGSVRKGPRFFQAGTGEAFTRAAVAIGIAGVMLGRAVLLGDLLPFAASFVAASIRVFGRNGIAAVPAVITGLATICGGRSLAGAALTVLAAALLTGVVPGDVKRPWLVLPALVFAVTVIVKTTLLAFTGAAAYYYFSILFEAIFAALLTGVMNYGLFALKRKAGAGRKLTGEELFCAAVVFGGIIAGTSDIKFVQVSVKGVLSGFTILLAALAGGTGAGAATGAVLGVIPGLAYTVAPAAAAAYSFAGLSAGLGRSFEKAGVATGFLLGNIVLTVYLTDISSLVSVIAESGIAVLLFLLLPAGVVDKLKITLGIAEQTSTKLREENIQEVFKERIKNWARVFSELSRSFEQVSSTVGQVPQEQSLQKLMHLTAEKVCSDCSFYSTCWEREFYKTYQGLLELITLIEIYGKISPDDFSTELKKRCSRTKELAITLNCLYESYNLNRYWSKRLLESREIVAEQLKGIAGVMAGLPGDAELGLDTGEELAPLIRRKLKEAGIQLEQLSVVPRGSGAGEVALTHAACGGMMKCASVIQPLISSLLEQPVYKASPACTAQEGDALCQLRFYPDLKCRLALGVARAGKNGSLLSGDSHAFFYLKGGGVGLVLSDGMGAGPRAAMESGITISLLRRLLECGFGQDLAIKTVNSLLVLRSPGESFATVDLAVVNVYTGQADFVKIGAVPTFVLHGREVGLIKASSLPVGIVEDIEVATMSRKLQPGDVLVMVTDGVLDACQGMQDREEWLAGVLEDVAHMAPQPMAELILKLAQTGAGGPARVADDMTVLVARLETVSKRN